MPVPAAKRSGTARTRQNGQHWTFRAEPWCCAPPRTKVGDRVGDLTLLVRRDRKLGAWRRHARCQNRHQGWSRNRGYRFRPPALRDRVRINRRSRVFGGLTLTRFTLSGFALTRFTLAGLFGTVGSGSGSVGAVGFGSVGWLRSPSGIRRLLPGQPAARDQWFRDSPPPGVSPTGVSPEPGSTAPGFRRNRGRGLCSSCIARGFRSGCCYTRNGEEGKRGCKTHARYDSLP